MNFLLLSILGLFASCFCSKLEIRRAMLQKKIDSQVPRIEYVVLNSPETTEQGVQEFEHLLIKTMKEVDELIDFCKSKPQTVIQKSLDTKNVVKPVFMFAQFFLALRSAQATLQHVRTMLYASSIETGENPMSEIFPFMRNIQYSLHVILRYCTFLPLIKFPYLDDVALIVFTESIPSYEVVHVRIENEMAKQQENRKNLFIQYNADNLIHRFNQLNLLLLSYHSIIVRYIPTTMVEIGAKMAIIEKLNISGKIPQGKILAITNGKSCKLNDVCASFSLQNFLLVNNYSNQKFFSSDPAVVLCMLDSQIRSFQDDQFENFLIDFTVLTT